MFLHLRPHTLKMGWTDSAVRRYVRDAGPLLERLNELVRCDVTTANKRKADSINERIDDLEARIADLAAREELDGLRPPINGHQVMQFLEPAARPADRRGDGDALRAPHRGRPVHRRRGVRDGEAVGEGEGA